MHRRAVLSSSGTIAVVLFSGCLAAGFDPDNGTPTDGTPAEDDGPPNVLESAIETTDTGCKRGSEAVDVTFESDAIVLEGVATAPTPCHDVTIKEAKIESGTLYVSLGLERQDGICVECVGAIEYAARIELESVESVDTILIEHENPGEAHTIERDEQTPSNTHSPSPHTDDTAPLSHEEAMIEPDSDVQISLENRHDQRHDVSITVSRASGEIVFQTTESVEAGQSLAVYNLREADPNGVEDFTIEAAMDGQAESITVETSACYGSVEVGVNEDGTLYPVYSIC